MAETPAFDGKSMDAAVRPSQPPAMSAPRYQRIQNLAEWAGLEPREIGTMTAMSSLPHDVSESLIAQSVGSFPIPMGMATGFVVDGSPVVVPMAGDVPRLVQDAMDGAALASEGGGFRTEVLNPVAMVQLDVRGVKDALAAREAVTRRATGWLKRLDAHIPQAVALGGGARSIEARIVGEWGISLQLHVDSRDAVSEESMQLLGEELTGLAGKALGTKDAQWHPAVSGERRVAVFSSIPSHALGSRAVRAMVAAAAFWQDDAGHAVAANAQVLAAVEAVLLAAGGDHSSSLAHAFAVRNGKYAPLASIRTGTAGALEASLVVPLGVGVGRLQSHPTAVVNRRILGDSSPHRLAAIAGAAGLGRCLGMLRANA